MPIKKEQIDYLAELAKLHVTADEKKRMHKQISKILDYVAQLSKLTDLDETDKFVDPVKNINVWRQDEIDDSSTARRKSILNNAPDSEDNLVKTKPVFPPKADQPLADKNVK